ncbi:cytochrome P450 [Nocardiopsis mwathae]|uniref:Cytochrome P450 n=1 Tax=Nocardiopsis mwathae TaxID=1472723 RepID=A0A7W9YM67_9ACTN|nr:cytochrome P450 [Nocardiopsis mwathae]MBB6174554.1 cytochrome P450 [Nocardiopsis mwathae]
MSPTLLSTSLPPGPAADPAAQRDRFARDPFGYLEELHREHGTMFTLDLGALGNERFVEARNNGKWVFLTRPHQIKRMYTAGGETVSGAHANAVFFGTPEESVAYIDGPEHRRRRARIRPELSGARDYTALISAVAEGRAAHWPEGGEVSLFLELQAITAEIIVEVVCGNLPAADRAELAALLPRTENAAQALEDVLAADAEIRAFVAARMGSHLRRSDELGRDDLLAALQRHAAHGDASLTPEVIRDEVFSLLYTGFSTTANTLSWVFARIARHPGVYRRVMAELGERFTLLPAPRKAYADLPYLEAVITETLRLHPVSGLNGVRMLTAPYEIDGHLLPAGTILVHCAYLLQRSPEVYADPLEFRPERFLEGTACPYSWAAFGGGNRMCVGRNYAQEEMRVLAAVLLSARRLHPIGPFPEARQQGIFMAPADGARVTTTRRTGTAPRCPHAPADPKGGRTP